MVVAAGSIFSESFKTIKHLIDDNRVILSGSYPAFPDKSPVYPLCTIESRADHESKSFGCQNRGLTFNFEIICYSKSAKQLDEIANEIDYILTTNQSAVSYTHLTLPTN